MTVTQELSTSTDQTDEAAPPTPKLSRRVRVALALCATSLVALAAVLGWEWHSTSGDLAALRDRQAESDKAGQVASDYVTRSLTYDYRNLDPFFAGVVQDASNSLQDRYNQVRETLGAIMTEAQVVATGTVVATAVQPAGDNRFEVTVFATQKTENVQQPDASTVPNLLSVTVAHDGGQWLVDNYSPK